MKKIFAILFVAVFSMAMINNSNSQVTVTPGPATNYADLKLAFDAINAGTHGAGAITVSINATHVLSDSAVLRGGVFTSCVIRPTALVTVSISAAKTAIRLNGADNVTIDGRIGGVGSTRSLTVTNSFVSTASADASTIQMVNGASNNILRYVNANLNVPTTSGGIGGFNVEIGALIPGTTGNHDNTVEFCLVNGGQRGISTRGNSSATVGYTNDRTIVRNNIVKNVTQLHIFAGTASKDNTFTQNEIFNDNASIFGFNQVRAISIQGLGLNDVTRNNIHDMVYADLTAPLTSAGVVGIISIPVITLVPGAPSTATVNIVNNMVSVTAISGALFCYGLFPASTAPPSSVINYTANVYYNSVLVYGSSASTPDVQTIGIEHSMTGSGSVYNQYNNVVRNDRTGGSGLFTFHIGSDLNPQFATNPDSIMSINVDYNTVWASDTINGFDAAFNGFGYAGSPRVYRDSVATYNIRFPNFSVNNSELHTAFRPVTFVSTSNLHLVPSAVGGDMNARPSPGITTIDIDGEPRNATFPYRGADELVEFPFKVLSVTYALEAITNVPPPPSNTNQADVITVELRTPGCALITSSTATLPPTPGNTANFAFGNLVGIGTPFYIKVIHRNSLPVWSATTQSFAGATLSYDFTDLATKAFGVNATKLINTEYSAYGGDVNQDGIIDAGDISALDNASGGIGINPFDPGYAETDVNFDIFIDASDQSIVDNNVGVFEQAPCGPTTPLLNNDRISILMERKRVGANQY